MTEPTRTEKIHARTNTPGADLIFKVFTALLVPLIVAIFVWIWNIDRQVLLILEHQDNAAKFWVLHGWEKDHINRLRVEHDKPIVSWPLLPGRPGRDGH